MSYGPQLPLHLQKQKESISHDIENDSNIVDTENASYGPALPPEIESNAPVRKDVKSNLYCPQLPSTTERSSISNNRNKTTVSDVESDDDDIVGPRLPSEGGKTLKQEQIDIQLENRARLIKEKSLETCHEKDIPKRDSWMLDLPAEKAKNFGLGPRQFSKSSGSKPQRDRSWTDTPEMKAKRAALAASGAPLEDNDPSEHEDNKDVLQYMASLKRDQDMESVANELKQKRGSDSLVELHDKDNAKKQKREKYSAGMSVQCGASERRPFDRDIDLQANRFDEAAKKAMLKKARKLNDNFSSGNQKYL